MASQINARAWLFEKSSESWGADNISAQLNKEIIAGVVDAFSELDSASKLQLLLSFLSLGESKFSLLKDKIQEIVSLALKDTDDWVVMLAHMLSDFHESQKLSFSSIKPYLEESLEKLRKSLLTGVSPLQPYHNMYLCNSSQAPAALLTHFTYKPYVKEEKTPLPKAESTPTVPRDRPSALLLARQTAQESGVTTPRTPRTPMTPFRRSGGPVEPRGFQKRSRVQELDIAEHGALVQQVEEMKRKRPGGGAASTTPGARGRTVQISPMAFEEPTFEDDKTRKKREKREENEAKKQEREEKKRKKKEEKEAQRIAKEEKKLEKEAKAMLSPKRKGTKPMDVLADTEADAATPSFTQERPPEAPPEPSQGVQFTSRPADIFSGNMMGVGGGTRLLSRPPAQSLETAAATPAQAPASLLSDLPGDLLGNIGNMLQTPFMDSTPTQQTQTPAPSFNNVVPRAPAAVSTVEDENSVISLLGACNSLSQDDKAVIMSFFSGNRVNPCPLSGPVRQLLLNQETKTNPDNTGMYTEHIVFEINYDSGQWRKLRRRRPVGEW